MSNSQDDPTDSDPTDFEAGSVLNEHPKPRVLFWDTGFDWTPIANAVRQHVPTVEVTRFIDKYNLSEWDCLVTNCLPVSVKAVHEEVDYEQRLKGFRWSQNFAAHLSIVWFCPGPVYPSDDARMLDVRPEEGAGEDLSGTVVLAALVDVVGRHLHPVKSGLPEGLEKLVKSDLIPAVEQRTDHLVFRRKATGGHHESDLALRPFLYGPDQSILAASYQRNAEASVWLLPHDITRPDLWVVEALREWHGLYPHRFPRLPDWQDATEWQTASEMGLRAERKRITDEMWQTFEHFQAEDSKLEDQVADAAEAASRYERALLLEDGEELAEAVGKALTELGFSVEDMDKHFPVGKRREDFRITQGDWIALVEVKGFKGGVKETGMHTSLSRWVKRFILDKGKEPSARWYVANHNRFDDPNTRPNQFQNKNEVLDEFETDDGLLLDTRALFDLVRLVQEEPSRKPAARRLLIDARRVINRISAADLEAFEIAGEGETA